MTSKVVFDTNVLISATLWDNSSAQKVLLRCLEENAQIFSSQEIIKEYQKILARDFDYEEQEIVEILKKIFQFVNIIVPNIRVEAVKGDPDDNKIVECALESNAEYILSYDKQLLKLKEYQGIKIIKPEELYFG